MKKTQYYYRRFKLCCIEAAIITIAVCAFLLPSFEVIQRTGDNYFTVSINGTQVGRLGSVEKLDRMLATARKQVAKDADGDDLVFMDLDIETVGRERVFGCIDDDAAVIENMTEIMKNNIRSTLHRSYTVKINETSVNLGSYKEVHELLEQALSPYDTNKEYQVELALDSQREVNVLEAVVTSKEELHEELAQSFEKSAGIEAEFEKMFQEIEPAIEKMFEKIEPTIEKDFEDYNLGLIDINYADKIEVVEAYLMEDELCTVEEAVNLVTKEQETQVIYKVVAGDTLSQICLTNNIPMDELIEINDALEDENTMIRVDQELVITVPEPDLSIIWKEEQVYTEDYEAQVQYIPNDDWYTTQSVTLQEPSAGRRKVAAVIEYENGQEIGREILKEQVYAEAVPKIVERGTKIPPTYIKPISGGRLSSGFGARSAPTKGASTNHKGIDWAVPIGTSVVASNTGTVAFAGWASGYGYAVYINHADGRQTRYGHLSKVLVKTGQSVSQGERIALSGNTGRSTGPHVHFEIRIGGSAVNPLKYLN